jgi:hypothetical protein
MRLLCSHGLLSPLNAVAAPELQVCRSEFDFARPDLHSCSRPSSLRLLIPSCGLFPQGDESDFERWMK